MKKMLLIVTLVFGMMLTLNPLASFAAATDLPPVDISVEEDSLENVISPMYIPCPYWDPSDHRWIVRSYKPNREVFQRNHQHLVGGVYFSCDEYKVYTVRDNYCACGLHKETVLYVGDKHYHK